MDDDDAEVDEELSKKREKFRGLCLPDQEAQSVSSQYQGCKLLSDIGQCPTKFGKCPRKMFLIGHWSDHTKKIVTYIFFAVTKSDCKFTIMYIL